MKKLLWIILALVIIGGHDAMAQSARGAIAFADFERVFTNYYKTKLSNDQLLEMSDAINREQAKMLLQFDVMQKEFKTLRDQALDEDLIESERARYRKEVDDKLIEIRRQEERIRYFNESQQKRWEEQNARIRGELVEELRGKIRDFGKARRFQAVLDTSQVNEKGVPAALYYDEEQDVTADVIRYVNEF